MKKLVLSVVCLLFVAGSAIDAQERRSRRERQQEQMEKVRKMVDAQDYRFVAQHAIPMGSRSIHLSPEYDVHIHRDTVTAHLPYFGRAYVAPMNPLEGGIKFNSTNFEYSLQQSKRGGWMVHITPKDAQRNFRLMLHITTTGSATLSVSDNTRQNISFNGFVEERR
jgi:Ni/Co efflux regulator RcnB